MHPFIELCGENISSTMTKTICNRLQQERIEALCLRECTITDKDYRRIVKRAGHSYTLRHLSLCVDIVTDSFRVQTLAQTIQHNLSLSGLLWIFYSLHGSSIRDHGMAVLQPSLLLHPGIVILDLSDCQLGDDGIDHLCQLLPGNKTKHGLRELVLSSNPDITSIGWNKLTVALAAGGQLATLCVDYNDLGDAAAACILTAVAGSNTLETLDMEATGVTDVTGKLFLQLLINHKSKLKDVNLDENDISREIMRTIHQRFHRSDLHIDLTIDPVTEPPSDDDLSLATSEPPLDETNSLLGYDKDSRRNSTVTHQDTCRNDGVDNDDSNVVKPIFKSGNLIPLAVPNIQSKSAVLDQPNEGKVDTIRSRSMCDIRSQLDTENTIGPISLVGTGGCKQIHVTESLTDECSSERTKRTAEQHKMLLVPETPSLVSLHTYGKTRAGKEDGDFQPFNELSTRPVSAPILQNNRLTVQGIGNSPVRSKPSQHAVVKPTVIATVQRPEHLSPHTSLRRFSTGSATLSTESDNDAHASLRSTSVRDVSHSHRHRNENDLDVEDL